MAKPDVSAYQTFDQITSRLDEIIGAVRSKDTSLERSLDLFDEALALGSVAVELVDSTDFTPDEEARLAGLDGGDDEAGEAGDPAEAGASVTDEQVEQVASSDDGPEAESALG